MGWQALDCYNTAMDKISHDSEAPAHGQQVITACALIHANFDGVEKVFLPKRAATKKFLPGVYEIPGGHIDFGENIVTGLKREIMEEFGMNIAVGDPFAVFDYTNHVKGSHSLEVVYFARFTDPIKKIAIDSEDHETYGWFGEVDLPSILSGGKNEDDNEIAVLRKAFRIFSGEGLNLA